MFTSCRSLSWPDVLSSCRARISNDTSQDLLLEPPSSSLHKRIFSFSWIPQCRSSSAGPVTSTPLCTKVNPLFHRMSPACHRAWEGCRTASNIAQEKTVQAARYIWAHLNIAAQRTKTFSLSCLTSLRTHVFTPVATDSYKMWQYLCLHKIAISGNLLAWSAILIFCGTLYGFKAVALPMVIGMGPGTLGGILLGVLAAKTLKPPEMPLPPQLGEDPPIIDVEDPSTKETVYAKLQSLQTKFNDLPYWTRTLLIAIAASAHLAACAALPYAAGAFSGSILGFMFSYNALQPMALENNNDATTAVPQFSPAGLQAVSDKLEALRLHVYEDKDSTITTRLEAAVSPQAPATADPRIVQQFINHVETVQQELKQLMNRAEILEAQVQQLQAQVQQQLQQDRERPITLSPPSDSL